MHKDIEYKFPFTRENENQFVNILGYYQAISCIENKYGKTLLDIGSNDGYITNILSKYFEKTVDIEPSKEQYEISKKKYKNIDFYNNFIENFESNELFDTISILAVYNCVEERENFLKSAIKFLKKDGVVIIQVSNADAVNKRIAEYMGTLKNRYELSKYNAEVGGVKKLYNIYDLKKEIESFGLKVIKTGGIMYKPFTDVQMNWFIENGLWNSGYGWGREGVEKDWCSEFCKALYEYGKTCPEECAVIYVVVKLK
ncbi:class I SAM-dependent methyltransferase [Brachyspira pilosicoli]|nr:methyltransferase domain-containing protein [Brachyspira pilosicoli]